MRPVRSPGMGRPRGRDVVYGGRPCRSLGRRRRDLPGSWATPARMPRSPTPAEPRTPGTVPAPAVVPSALVTASASAMLTDIVARSRGLQGSLCTLRSRGRPRTTQHSVPAGRSSLAGQDSHLLGRREGFRHVATWHPPSPGFAWRKTSPSPTGHRSRGSRSTCHCRQGSTARPVAASGKRPSCVCELAEIDVRSDPRKAFLMRGISYTAPDRSRVVPTGRSRPARRCRIRTGKRMDGEMPTPTPTHAGRYCLSVSAPTCEQIARRGLLMGRSPLSHTAGTTPCGTSTT